jgi:hypothetical protein
VRLALTLFIGATFLGGCGGGGGGGGTVRADGRVLSVSTGGPPNPPATAQIGGASTQTESDSGVFILNVAPGATTLAVLHPVFPTFTFDFPPITANTTLGDFWIGPETVTIVGSVIHAQTSEPIPDALVLFAGKRATTAQDGEFTLTGVAYDSQNDFVFQGILGTVQKSGFLTTQFTANQNPVGGVITLPPILLAPISDPNPPGPPYNLWGVVTVQGGTPTGTTVTLLESGTPIRRYAVGGDGRYYLWAVPGTYVLRFEKTGFQTVDIPVIGFDSPDDVIRNDVTLVPN